jgi:tRNA (adenine57-N1/adenine58-N1)-methyltransferase
MTPADPAAAPGILRDRDAVVVIDRKQRTYLRTLRAGRVITVRGNAVPCDEIIGRPEGCVITSARNERLLVLRPTYAQLIPSLPRQAQPIYPKDVGPILLWGDIAAGMRVIEVGVGPGAVTLALLRAVGAGALASYELREDFAARARDNVARFHGDAPNWTLHVGDAFAASSSATSTASSSIWPSRGDSSIASRRRCGPAACSRASSPPRCR